MAHKKVHLPSKICPICLRPFSWRKKWQKQWLQIKYCSQRCRKDKAAKQLFSDD
nr:DUF2256 domain-containing protein [Pseudoalteromonas ulvae]